MKYCLTVLKNGKEVDWIYDNSNNHVYDESGKQLLTEYPDDSGLYVYPFTRSDNRIKQLANLYKQIRGNLYGLNLRLSPYSPNPCSCYIPYDFSIDIANFLNIAWSLGKINTNFDCRINHCELSENAITAFRAASVEIRTDSCGPHGMPFDVLVDGSCIWCSSANFLRLNNWRDYDDFDQAKSALTEQWFEHWKRVGLRCNYKQCNKFNPAMCHGMCIAKNEFVKYD